MTQLNTYTASLMMKCFARVVFSFVFLLAMMQSSFSQAGKEDCKAIQTGIFYFYPQNSRDKFIEIREGEYLIERNTVTGDTCLWKVKWESDCVYRLKYISASAVIDKATIKILRKKDLVYAIQQITDDYYTFNGYVDDKNNNPIQHDTIWMTEKMGVPDRSLVHYVPKDAYSTAAMLADSPYALLHLYRPGKFTNSLGNFIVYLNKNPVFVARNNSGSVFKIYKEGPYEISSRLLDDSAGATIDIRFGRKYYVKSFINWTVTSQLYNFRLGIQEMEVLKGEEDFAKVKYWKK